MLNHGEEGARLQVAIGRRSVILATVVPLGTGILSKDAKAAIRRHIHPDADLLAACTRHAALCADPLQEGDGPGMADAVDRWRVYNEILTFKAATRDGLAAQVRAFLRHRGDIDGADELQAMVG